MIRDSIRVAIALLALLHLLDAALVFADPPRTIAGHGRRVQSPTEYRTDRLHVRTDLPAEDAAQLVERLETTLDHAAKYWGTEPRGRIECYVVQDLNNWSDAELPNRLSRVIVSGVSGATIPGRSGDGRGARKTATVFACADRGVAEHEIVHAYCLQTFGALGPDWYKEGMAEMVVLGATRESGVRCSREQLKQLQENPQRTVGETMQAGDFGNRIFQSMRLMLASSKNRNQHVPVTDWTDQDSENARLARCEYLHSWALCYLLMHNPNYSPRFHLLGTQYVANRPDRFDEVFLPVRDQLAFEHAFFLEHIDTGYRVDLCSWDWNKRHRPLEDSQSTLVRIEARRGYQPSGILVRSGERVAFHCNGKWTTSFHVAAVDANGNPQGAGRLVAVVLDEFRLSEPVLLGTSGTFVAPRNGKLFLRCQDDWNSLQDNGGQILVALSQP